MEMTDEMVRLVRRCIDDARGPAPRRKTHAWSQQEIDRLAQRLQAETSLATVDQDELRVTMALCLLGPLSAGIPPVALRNDALAKLRRFVPETSLRVTHAFEVMVAYGCGVWRKVDTGSGGWEHRWQPALDQLSASVLAWLRATAAWLHFDIQLRGYAFTAPFPSWGEAEALSFLLWAGKCDCWRLKAGDADEPLDHRTAQRAARCLREHRLRGWNPADLALNDFIRGRQWGDLGGVPSLGGSRTRCGALRGFRRRLKERDSEQVRAVGGGSDSSLHHRLDEAGKDIDVRKEV